MLIHLEILKNVKNIKWINWLKNGQLTITTNMEETGAVSKHYLMECYGYKQCYGWILSKNSDIPWHINWTRSIKKDEKCPGYICKAYTRTKL